MAGRLLLVLLLGSHLGLLCGKLGLAESTTSSVTRDESLAQSLVGAVLLHGLHVHNTCVSVMAFRVKARKVEMKKNAVSRRFDSHTQVHREIQNKKKTLRHHDIHL